MTIKCKICNHEWFPRTLEPYKCPKCQKPLNQKKKNVTTCAQKGESNK